MKSAYLAPLLGLLSLPVLLTSFSTAWSCQSPTRPEADSAYATIVLAEVIGVRLTDYAEARERQIRQGSTYAWDSDASPGYEVDIIPIEVFKGSARDQLTLKIPRGCAIPRAELNLFGIFYIDDRGLALPMYQDNLEYRARLANLGSKYTAPCVTSEERLEPHPCWKPRHEYLACLTLVKDVTYAAPSSCPAGVQELRERLHNKILGHYDWMMPPADPGGVK